MARPVIN